MTHYVAPRREVCWPGLASQPAPTALPKRNQTPRPRAEHILRLACVHRPAHPCSPRRVNCACSTHPPLLTSSRPAHALRPLSRRPFAWLSRAPASYLQSVLPQDTCPSWCDAITWGSTHGQSLLLDPHLQRQGRGKSRSLGQPPHLARARARQDLLSAVILGTLCSLKTDLRIQCDAKYNPSVSGAPGLHHQPCC